MQALHSLNLQKIAAYTRNICAHTIKHAAQLLQVWFACSIVYSRLTLCHDSRHYDVSRTSDRSLIKQHIASLQFLSTQLIHITSFEMLKFCAQLAKSEEMGVETSASYLISARLCDNGLPVSAKQRTDHQD